MARFNQMQRGFFYGEIPMARPKRLNADYFSHDSGMRDDPKIKALRNKFGITGYAVWCMMLEILTNSDHFKRSIDDIEIEILSADFGISPESFSEILSYMLRLKLLQTGDSGEYLSQKLTDRLQPVIDKRRNSCRKGVSVTESTQRKVKETKGKEIIKSKPKTKVFVPPTYEEFLKYCKAEGFSNIAERAFKGYQAGDWHDAKGSKIIRWKQKLQNGWFKSENKDAQIKPQQIRQFRP